MKLSVVIPLGDMARGVGLQDRLDTLEYSLRTFWTRHRDTQVIVVAQNIPPQSWPGVIVVPVTYPQFNKGWCINVGVRMATAPVVAISESDMWAPHPYLHRAVDWMVKARHPWCFAWSRLFYLNSEEKHMLFHTGMAPLERVSAVVRPTPGYSEGGILLFNRPFFWSIGGQNEFLCELGGIDNELARRAQHQSRSYPMYPHMVYHLWHTKVRQRRSLTRLKNVDIYKYVKANPADSIRTLNRRTPGDAKPLCAATSFYRERIAR